MSQRKDRLDIVSDDIEFLETHNQLTQHQRNVIHDFEMLMISAEMQGNTKLFSIYRYRLLLYCKNEDLKCRSLNTI